MLQKFPYSQESSVLLPLNQAIFPQTFSLWISPCLFHPFPSPNCSGWLEAFLPILCNVYSFYHLPLSPLVSKNQYLSLLCPCLVIPLGLTHYPCVAFHVILFSWLQRSNYFPDFSPFLSIQFQSSLCYVLFKCSASFPLPWSVHRPSFSVI